MGVSVQLQFLNLYTDLTLVMVCVILVENVIYQHGHYNNVQENPYCLCYSYLVFKKSYAFYMYNGPHRVNINLGSEQQ